VVHHAGQRRAVDAPDRMPLVGTQAGGQGSTSQSRLLASRGQRAGKARQPSFILRPA
jgi:hypothetical protein